MSKAERIHSLLYSCDSRDELCERVVELEELVREMYEDQCASGDEWKYRDRMRELEMEVDG